MKALAVALILSTCLVAAACEKSETPPFTLKIVNDGNLTIFWVYFARSLKEEEVKLKVSPNWGPDQLGRGNNIQPGTAYTWTIDPDTYGCRIDVKIQLALGLGDYTYYNVDVCSGHLIHFAPRRS